MIKPITPKNVTEHKKTKMPDEVIEVFNDLIAERMSGGYSTFKLCEVSERITKKLNITRSDVYDRHYCDVEDIYGKAGWKVEFDKPGYNESYDAFFTFTPGRKNHDGIY